MTANKKAKKRIALPKSQARRVDDLRARLDKIGIDERDVPAAVSWARKITSKI